METGHVYKSIVAVIGAMSAEGISKSRKNLHQNYNFRGIDEVYNALSSHLAANNLVILPNVISNTAKDTVSGAKGTPTIAREIVVEFTLVSALDGSQCKVTTIGEAMDTSDKSANKAMSAAYKYMALMLFAIPTEGDNDADAVTHTRTERPSGPRSLVPELDLSIAVDEVKKAKTQNEVDAITAKHLPALRAAPKDKQDAFRAVKAARIAQLATPANGAA